MQQVMAMKSPELVAILPEIEKIDFEARVALVRRGHENLSSVIKNWDKFAEILAAQRDLSKSDIKGQAKSLKHVRSKLEMALRQIGRAHVCIPVTNAQLVCRLLLETRMNSSLTSATRMTYFDSKHKFKTTIQYTAL